MNIIDNLLSTPPAKWICARLEMLPDSAKFRACNSVRSLSWANDIAATGLEIPATYCALHATEEAVAAFVSCAKFHNYGDDAKINLKDHFQKAAVSLLAQRTSIFLAPFDVALACSEGQDDLIAKFVVDGQTHYAAATTKLFSFSDEVHGLLPHFYDDLIASFGEKRALRDAVVKGQEARNSIFYADNKGYPTGFENPEEVLRRECQLSLGLIWAAIDMTENASVQIPFIKQALRTAQLIINELKKATPI